MLCLLSFLWGSSLVNLEEVKQPCDNRILHLFAERFYELPYQQVEAWFGENHAHPVLEEAIKHPLPYFDVSISQLPSNHVFVYLILQGLVCYYRRWYFPQLFRFSLLCKMLLCIVLKELSIQCR